MSAPAQQRLPVADAAAVRVAAWDLIRGDTGAMVVVVLLNCLAAAAGLAGPRLLGTLVNDFQAGTASSRVDQLAGAIIGFAVLQLLLTRYARYAGQRLGERALRRLRDQFVDRVLALPTSVVEKAGTGDLMARSSGDVSTVGNSLREAVPQVFVSLVQVLFVLVAVFLLHPVLGLVGLVGLPVVALVTRWYLARARDAYLAEGEANTEMAENLSATVEGARTAEALGLQQRRIDESIAVAEQTVHTRLATLFLRSVLFPVVDLGHVLPVTLALLVGGALYHNGMVTLGTVVAACLYLWQLVSPVDTILMWIEMLQRSGASFARITGVGQVTVEPQAASGPPVDDRIEAIGVCYAYNDGGNVLHGIDLVVRQGERLAVVGPSGAGKSTLGRLLAGIDEPTEGSLTVGGVPVSRLSAEERKRRVLMVTQEHHVFLGTLRDNLTIAAHEATDETLLAALVTVDADWADALPDGLSTTLGVGGVWLDSAQAQQLALARVMLADPHTVLLDEATSLLAPRSARRAERSLSAALEGRTVIAIAHRLHTAHDADRIVVMEEGLITEDGSHDQLVAKGGSYARLWRSWHGSD